MSQNQDQPIARPEPVPFFPAIWEVLHDAVVVSVAGSLPGTAVLQIDASYLRNQFPDPGATFLVVLKNCSLFNYRDYGSKGFRSMIDDFPEDGFEILTPELQIEGQLQKQIVWGADGVMEIVATDGSLYVEDRQIELQELLDVATDYWTAFEIQG